MAMGVLDSNHGEWGSHDTYYHLHGRTIRTSHLRAKDNPSPKGAWAERPSVKVNASSHQGRVDEAESD
jgi:hypothetical protein